MRLRRATPAAHGPLTLPGAGDTVRLAVDGTRIPARVLQSGGDELVLAITVPTRPFTTRQLENLVVEYQTARGRVRLQGSFACPDAGEPELLRMSSPRSVEVLQERDYVRIRAARPVLVYGAGGSTQISSFTVDVSGGGLLLAGPETLKVGEEIEFCLSMEPGQAPVTGAGEVVRVDGMGRRAISFTRIGDLDRRRLVRFIFECQRAERRRGLGS